MNKPNQLYQGRDVAFIIPTKDRPEKMRDVLTSMASQTVSCGRIIVVDGGKSVRNIVIGFSDRLPVEYHECHPPGQIRQRNMAISLLDDRAALVGFLDDDIVLEPHALQSMINFWNNCESETAGVSFNIVNNPPYRHSWARALIGMSSKQQGRVLRSGYNVAISPVRNDLRAQWLCGGATVWRYDILKNYHHQEISSRWAICEDLLFSYPIGKHFPLYVCADAKVRHEHVYDHKVKMKYRYYGRTVTLWRLYVVESHPEELSRIFYLWMLMGQVVARFTTGIFLLRLSDIQYAIGQIEGAAIGLSAIMYKSSLVDRLNETS